MRKSLSERGERHVVASRKEGQYHSFPDIVRADDGSLTVVLNVSDKHVFTWATVCATRSLDGGATWSPLQTLNPKYGNCPRVTRLPDGELIIMNRGDLPVYRSKDHGAHFEEQPWVNQSTREEGLVQAPVCIPDRLIARQDGTLGCIAQVRMGTYGLSRMPTTDQAHWANMFYISGDRAKTWKPLSVVSFEKDLSLCETSACRLPDGRLLAVMRENTFDVYEPMYIALSEDEGASWGEVIPTPLIGHRPCVGVTQSGKLLITYRDVSLARATVAWLGDLAELREFAVHGYDPCGQAMACTFEGLTLTHLAGRTDPANLILRPMSNPFTAKAELAATVRVSGQSGETGAHFAGYWWGVTGDSIRCSAPGAQACPLQPEAFHRLRWAYEPGVVRLYVDDALRCAYPVKPGKMTRPVLVGSRVTRGFGGPAPDWANIQESSCWTSLSLSIDEPSYRRNYAWKWTPADGMPNAYEDSRVLVLKSAEQMWGGDYGYSGWIEQPDGTFLCAYHHKDADQPPQLNAYILVTRFTEADFESES